MNIEEIVEHSKKGASYFFDEKTMKFWQTRLIQATFPGQNETWLFITSDKFGSQRVYNVRRIRTDGHIETLAKCETANKAKVTAKNISKAETTKGDSK